MARKTLARHPRQRKLARYSALAPIRAIEPIRDSDVGCVCALMAQSFPEDGPVTADLLGDYASCGVVLVARRSDRVVGLGMLLGDWVQNLCVAPGYRGLGVGRSILEALEQRGWSGGLKAIGLVTPADMADFYRRCGYRHSPAQRTADPDWVEMIKDRPAGIAPQWTGTADRAMLSGM